MTRFQLSKACRLGLFALILVPLVLPPYSSKSMPDSVTFLSKSVVASASIPTGDQSIRDSDDDQFNALLCRALGFNCIETDTAICGGLCVTLVTGVVLGLFMQTDIGLAIFGPMVVGLNWIFDRIADGVVWLWVASSEGLAETIRACAESGGQAAVVNNEVNCGYTYVLPIPGSFPGTP